MRVYVDDVGMGCEVEEVQNGMGGDGEKIGKVGTGQRKGDGGKCQDERGVWEGRGVLTEGKKKGAGGKNVCIGAEDGGDERRGEGLCGAWEVNEKDN